MCLSTCLMTTLGNSHTASQACAGLPFSGMLDNLPRYVLNDHSPEKLNNWSGYVFNESP